MSESIKKLLEIAHKEVGIREGAVNNTGARIAEYQAATWLAPAAWPWCAAFACWVMREWLEDDEVRADLGLASAAQAAKWRCRDASAFGWEDWAKHRRVRTLRETDRARAGDFAVFDFSHIGLVIADQSRSESMLATIEGNTNAIGERDGEDGDGVWIKERSPVLAKSYIRLCG